MDNCDYINEKIYLYIDSVLDEKETVEITNHLKECETCKREYEYWKYFKTELKTHTMRECPSKLKEKLYSIGLQSGIISTLRTFIFVIVEILKISKHKFELQSDEIKRLRSNYLIPNWVLRWVFYI